HLTLGDRGQSLETGFELCRGDGLDDTDVDGNRRIEETREECFHARESGSAADPGEDNKRLRQGLDQAGKGAMGRRPQAIRAGTALTGSTPVKRPSSPWCL